MKRNANYVLQLELKRNLYCLSYITYLVTVNRSSDFVKLTVLKGLYIHIYHTNIITFYTVLYVTGLEVVRT